MTQPLPKPKPKPKHMKAKKPTAPEPATAPTHEHAPEPATPTPEPAPSTIKGALLKAFQTLEAFLHGFTEAQLHSALTDFRARIAKRPWVPIDIITEAPLNHNRIIDAVIEATAKEAVTANNSGPYHGVHYALKDWWTSLARQAPRADAAAIKVVDRPAHQITRQLTPLEEAWSRRVDGVKRLVRKAVEDEVASMDRPASNLSNALDAWEIALPEGMKA